MKLSQLRMVNQISDQRTRLLHQLANIDAIGKVRVSIDGEPQDDTFVALVRPSIKAEIKARILELGRDLEALGVTIA